MELSQLLPFNECRFDACMAYLAGKHGRPLTKYEMVKLHALIDVYHVLEYGKPVIGGALSPWQFGPVVEKAYNRVRVWEHKHDEDGTEPENFQIEDPGQNGPRFAPTLSVSADDFSRSELAAMDAAWQRVVGRGDNFHESQDFFHGDTPIGRAWQKARAAERDLDWDEILAEFEKDEDVRPGIKEIIRY